MPANPAIMVDAYLPDIMPEARIRNSFVGDELRARFDRDQCCRRSMKRTKASACLSRYGAEASSLNTPSLAWVAI